MKWRSIGTNDAALLDKWRTQRDAGAFTELVTRHAGMVFATCNRILGDRAAAEEVAQECFLALARGNGEVPASPGGWLHTVAARLALKRVHSDVKRRAREEVFVKRQEKPPHPEWDDIKRYVDEAIEELPESFQSVVVAHFLEQRSHREIAKELGVTRQAVTYRIRKGISEIRRRLDQQGITLSIAALGPMLSKNAVEPAPATLLSDLGRMAMAGGKTAKDCSTAVLKSSWSAFHTSVILATSATIVIVAVAFIPLLKPDVAPDMTALSSVAETLPDRPDESGIFFAPALEIEEEFVADKAMEEPPTPEIPSPAETKIEEVIPGFTSQISGRVVMAADNAPVAGVKVTATTHKSTQARPSGPTAYISHSGYGTTTDDGSFTIKQLKEADYELEVRVGGFTQLDWPLVVDTRNVATAAYVVVKLRENGNDFGGSLRGTVTEGGKPVEGLLIAYRYDPIEYINGRAVFPRVDPGNPPAPDVRTDENGEYFLSNMPVGTLSVQVSGVGDDVPRFVEIHRGEETVVNFMFPPRGTSGIEGWVSPPEVGAGVQVLAWTLKPNGESTVHHVSADASGYFIFDELSSGHWQIHATPSPIVFRTSDGLWSRSPRLSTFVGSIAGRQAEARRELYQTYGDAVSGVSGVPASGVLYDEAWVTTEEGMITWQDLDLSEGKVLRGHVANLLEGESGEVIVFQGARLDLDALNAAMIDSLKADYPWRQATLENDGSFRVTGLGLSSYIFETTAQYLHSFTVTVVTSSGRFGASSSVGLTLRRAQIDGELVKSAYFGNSMVLNLR